MALFGLLKKKHKRSKLTGSKKAEFFERLAKGASGERRAKLLEQARRARGG